MIFVTVGSALPFDRLIAMVDEAVSDKAIDEEVFAQVGSGEYAPKNFSYTRFLSKAEFQQRLSSASIVISHAGIGTITESLKEGCSLLVLPRDPDLGEIVDDHQNKTAEAYAALEHLLVFRNSRELTDHLQNISCFQPKQRQPNVKGIARTIARFLEFGAHANDSSISEKITKIRRN